MPTGSRIARRCARPAASVTAVIFGIAVITFAVVIAVGIVNITGAEVINTPFILLFCNEG